MRAPAWGDNYESGFTLAMFAHPSLSLTHHELSSLEFSLQLKISSTLMFRVCTTQRPP